MRFLILDDSDWVKKNQWPEAKASEMAAVGIATSPYTKLWLRLCHGSMEGDSTAIPQDQIISDTKKAEHHV